MSPEFRVFRNLEDVPADFGPCALTIGNFDGVHAGHRRIMGRVAEMAREHGWRAAGMTFHPHPTRVVAPERAPILMSTPGERAEMMRGEGIDEVLILPFDAQVAAWTPDFFVREILVRKLKARAVLVGKDFRFGHKHAGDTELLRVMGSELGFVTELIPSVSLRGARISSSRIRELVEAGRVSSACRLLTRPFALAGDVVSGHGIGRRQTVPTLNLAPAFEVLPANGVYITRTHDPESGTVWKSVTNVGNRPTFNGDALTIETFLLEPLKSTPSRIRVEFLSRIRGERKFDSPEALRARIFTDVRSAERYFRHM